MTTLRTGAAAGWEQPAYSIIIPARNEELRIGPTLLDYAREFEDAEILVVLNACTDRTEEIVRQISVDHCNIRFIVIDSAVGKGGAVRTGLLAARAPLVGFADADGSAPASEMRRIFSSLGNDDGVIGSRWLRGAVVDVKQTWQRRLASRVFNLLVRGLFGIKFSDTQCGAKVFRASAIREVSPHVETANFAFDVDLLYLLASRGHRVKEIPVVWRDKIGSQLKLTKAAPGMFYAIMRLRLRYSALRILVPLFDRYFPTAPIRSHEHFSILILNWRDIKHPQAGGAEAYLHEQASRWVAMGHHVEWLTAGFRGCKRKEEIDGILVTRVGNARTVYALLPLEYLKRFRDRFDLIIDSENGIPFFSPLFSLKPKLCVMYHVHRRVFLSQLPWPVSWFMVWIELWLMPRVYRNVSFISISEDTKAEMQRYRLTDKPVHVIKSGIDSRMVAGNKAKEPSIVYVGRLKRYKRLDLLITALAQVRQAVPNAVLNIVGRGDDEARLRRLVAKLDLGGAVRFHGFVDEEQKRSLLQQAWVFVSPSSMEGWGITVIEANACGTPAIVFNVPGLREAVIDGLSGVVVEEGALLGPVIARLLADDTLRRRLEAGARARAAGLSWESSARQMLDLIQEEVLGMRPSLLLSERAWSLLDPRSENGEVLITASAQREG